MSNPTHATVVLSADNKSVTVVGVNGNQSSIHAHTTLAFWSRKDGGVTVRTDASHRSQTMRFDRYGRLFNTKSVPFGS